jgi:glucosamine 6-phosphate synthetase-like amidotransferase/phosphosugar isomerase protein
MIARRVVDEIDRLLNEGQLSRRKNAERQGVGRSTVCAIARGRRALHGKEAQSNAEPPVVAKRCPNCGYVVHMPCLVCRTRLYRELLKLGRAAQPERSAMPRRRNRSSRRRPREMGARVA